MLFDKWQIIIICLTNEKGGVTIPHLLIEQMLSGGGRLFRPQFSFDIAYVPPTLLYTIIFRCQAFQGTILDVIFNVKYT